MPDFRSAPGRLPPDERVYAVGDVHGCDERLADLHAMIAADLDARPIGSATLVHLGDYIDRGPDSRAVLQRVAGPPPAPGLRVINLAGNHEDMMQAALTGDAAAAGQWVLNGGDATLLSFGIGLAEPARLWAARLPATLRATLMSLPLRHLAGDYLFVHAGVRPGVPIARQDRHDLLWLREPFLSSTADFGAVVVHGHTPRPVPEVRPNRIGVDTGAVAGGALTCVVLEADRLAFLTA